MITTPNKASDEIKRLLDEMLQSQTYEEKKAILKRTTPLIEILEAPIKKLKEEEAARKEEKRIIKNALKELISALDGIKGMGPASGDVCEEIREVIHHGFIKPAPRHSWPVKFGMDTDAGEELINAALQRFFAHPEVIAASKSLKTPEDRLLAFQDGDVKTPKGSTFFSYFGVINKPLSRAEVEKIKRETQG